MVSSAAQDRMFTWWRQALRFVLPVECLFCRAQLTSDPVPFFCRACWASITPLQFPSCSCCGHPFPSAAAVSWTPNRRCQTCLDRPPAYRRIWTLYPYVPPLQDAICAFKYAGKIGLVRPLAELMLSAWPVDVDVDAIVPIPLHGSRLRSREFNQSLLLADRVGRCLGKPVWARHLQRVRPTDPQTTLSRSERLKNLRQAFVPVRPDLVAGKRIVLVDDVFTTGATLNECASVLMEAGAESVYGVTLARTMEASLIPDRVFAARAPGALPALGV